MQQLPPFLVTAALDTASAAVLQGLRDRNFPADRNLVPAHVTLFHHLPGNEHRQISDDLGTVASPLPPFPFSTGAPRFLGRGCALPLLADPLVQVRAELARRWTAWLTPQDRQPYKPHATVQNKVEPAVARALCGALADFAVEGEVMGLDLWAYQGGPWQFVRRVPFAAQAPRG